MAKPILILQMQRMGDLIMSFPLFLWLQKTFPDSRIHVVAEESFYQGLVALSPQVLYIPWPRHDHVLKENFSLAINLSHRQRAAWLAGRVRADEIIGPYTSENVLRVAGNWQLYRSSLVQNNRYNRFHWAELNALDAVDPAMIKRTSWPKLMLQPDNRRVGVFIGASQEDKRPRPEFFALLCKELIRRQYHPVILGGPQEKDLAEMVLKLCSVKPLNLAGKLSLPQLAGLFKSLGLLITPDTGPMHLAAWTGLATLNLSLGPVNPWETGPYQPGHTVIRSNISCSGCWECIQKKPLCSDSFTVRQVVILVERIRSGKWSDLKTQELKGINVHESGRKNGLYNLAGLKTSKTAASLMASFWHSFWASRFGLGQESKAIKKAALLKQNYPLVHGRFRQSAIDFLVQLKISIKKGEHPDPEFWRKSPPCFRPLSGYAHLLWQNSDYSSSSFRSSIRMVQDLLDILPGA